MAFVIFPKASRVRVPAMRVDSDWWRSWTAQPGKEAPVHVEVFGAGKAVVPARKHKPAAADRLPKAVDITTSEASPIQLRDYQKDAIAAVHGAWQSGKRAPLVVIATGGGKTIIAAELIRRLHAARRINTLFLAHRRELLDQTAQKVRLVSPLTRVGIVQAARNELGRTVTIASIQTLGHRSGRRLRELLDHGPYGFVVCDEAHHAVTPQWEGVLAALREQTPDALLMGMTATPGRADGVALDRVFDDVAFERNIFQLVEDGWLVPPRGFRVTLDVDLDKVETRNGDFVQSQLGRVMNTPHVNAAVVRAWQEFGHDRKTIVYGVDIDHALALQQEFSDAGYSCAALHSKLKPKDRKDRLREFRDGAFQLLINVEILTEGFDEPSAEAILFARPTQSSTLYAQSVGRGLRLYPAKTECLVIDCVGNGERHRLVQLASLAGFDPLGSVRGRGRDGEEVDDEEETPEVTGASIHGEEVDFGSHRAARARYQWRETTLGWILQIPRIGYFLVAWTDRTRDKATVRFFDQRPQRRDAPPRDVLRDPVAFDLAFGMVESEMDRIFNARSWRQNHGRRREPEEEAPVLDAATFVDLEDGLTEDMFIEDTMLRDAAWRGNLMSARQGALLVKLGVKQGSLPETMGEASDLIAVLQAEKDAKMRVPATAKQLAYLRVNGLPIDADMTKGKASKMIFKHRKGIPIS